MDGEKNISVKSKTTAEKIFSIATSVFLGISIVFCSIVMMQINRLGYVNIFGYSVFHVVTESMGDEVPVNSLTISKKTEIETIQVGDIISFRSKDPYMAGAIITHRVDDIRHINGKISLVTRGDTNNSIDPYYVTEENFVGKIVYTTPKGNFFSTLYSILTSKIGFFGIIVVPVLVLVTIIMQENIKKIRKEIKAIQKEIAISEEEKAKNEALRAELRNRLLAELKTRQMLPSEENKHEQTSSPQENSGEKA